MREILFRGKRLDNGEWVEGNYIFSPDADEGWKAIIIPTRNSYMFSSGNEDEDLGFENWHRVDPETVCQFTGLTFGEDKLFEGDIIEICVDYDDDFGYPATAYERAIIIWDEECFSFAVKIGNGLHLLNDWDWDNTEIIGNIFDNPELMEGGGTDDRD